MLMSFILSHLYSITQRYLTSLTEGPWKKFNVIHKIFEIVIYSTPLSILIFALYRTNFDILEYCNEDRDLWYNDQRKIRLWKKPTVYSQR